MWYIVYVSEKTAGSIAEQPAAAYAPAGFCLSLAVILA